MLTAHQLDQDQGLLTELRILSSLRPNDRITTNHATKPVVRIQKPDFFRPWYRFMNNESRNSNIAYLQSMFQRVIDRYRAAEKFNDLGLVQRLQSESLSAIDGIRKLQQTYEDDAQFQAAMDVSVDTVCQHLHITRNDLVPVEAPAPALAPGPAPAPALVPAPVPLAPTPTTAPERTLRMTPIGPPSGLAPVGTPFHVGPPSAHCLSGAPMSVVPLTETAPAASNGYDTEEEDERGGDGFMQQSF